MRSQEKRDGKKKWAENKQNCERWWQLWRRCRSNNDQIWTDTNESAELLGERERGKYEKSKREEKKKRMWWIQKHTITNFSLLLLLLLFAIVLCVSFSCIAIFVFITHSEAHVKYGYMAMDGLVVTAYACQTAPYTLYTAVCEHSLSVVLRRVYAHIILHKLLMYAVHTATHHTLSEWICGIHSLSLSLLRRPPHIVSIKCRALRLIVFLQFLKLHSQHLVERFWYVLICTMPASTNCLWLWLWMLCVYWRLSWWMLMTISLIYSVTRSTNDRSLFGERKEPHVSVHRH